LTAFVVSRARSRKSAKAEQARPSTPEKKAD
jgi:hypothetical protein